MQGDTDGMLLGNRLQWLRLRVGGQDAAPDKIVPLLIGQADRRGAVDHCNLFCLHEFSAK